MIGDVRAEHPRRRPHHRIARLRRESFDGLSLESLSTRQELDHDERQREDVRPRTGRAVCRRELLRCRIARRERLGGVRLRGRGCGAAHRLRDPEVEELHARRLSARAAEDEDVSRLDVPVNDAALVRDGEGLRDRVQELDHFAQRPRRPPLGTLSPDLHLEAFAVEPLEHRVGDPLPPRRRQRGDVARLADRRAPLREIHEEASLLHEAREELLAGRARQRRPREGLDGDAALPDAVGGPVHDRQRGPRDDLLDEVLAGDGRPYELERVRSGIVHAIRAFECLQCFAQRSRSRPSARP